MNELTTGVSWTAVFAGFVLSYLLGWLWYSPKLFGKKWAEGAGVSTGAAGDFPAAAMLFQALGTFGLAWLFGITAARNAASTILLTVLTVMFLVLANGKFAGKSNAAIAIEAAYVIAMGVVMFVCQGLLRGAPAG